MKRAEYAHAPARTSANSSLDVPAFGVYRTVDTDWFENAQDVLSDIQVEGRSILRRNGVKGRANLWRAKRAMGVTYVERRHTKRADLEQVDFSKLLRRIGEITTGNADVQLPIARVDWLGYRRTVLAAFFADSVELQQLAEERDAVGDALYDAGLPADMARIPDHVSLANWSVLPGVPDYFQENHRSAIRYMAGRELVGASIRAVALSNLMVGVGYGQPFNMEDWEMAAAVADPQELLMEVG